jgi:hypothetical protein
MRQIDTDRKKDFVLTPESTNTAIIYNNSAAWKTIRRTFRSDGIAQKTNPSKRKSADIAALRYKTGAKFNTRTTPGRRIR